MAVDVVVVDEAARAMMAMVSGDDAGLMKARLKAFGIDDGKLVGLFLIVALKNLERNWNDSACYKTAELILVRR